MYKTLLFLLAGAAIAADIKPLPTPVVTGGMPLMEAINARQSGRKYNPEHKIDDQTLSEILWVAWGVNQHGKRTIPTARNKQNMGLYVLTPDGTWRYEAKENQLVKVNDKNLIPFCEQQGFVKNAPLHLLYTAKDDRWGRAHVGSAYQNVYLYATSKELNTVIRGMLDTEGLTRELAPTDGQVVIAHQTVGYAN
ncbi:MAG: nitroreductase family protein [Akkermansia sp.]|nr:nitroreductase family protein [Akkermansia sp.]